MQKAMNHGGDSSTGATSTGGTGVYTNSQPLTFIDSDFVGAENTQATEYNYELTFPNEMSGATGAFHQGTFGATQSQMTQQLTQQLSQLDNVALSQTNNNNNGVNDLGNFKRLAL